MIRFPVPPASEITPQALYAQRRRFLQAGAALAAGSVLPTHAADTRNGGLGALVRSPLSTVEEPTPLRHVTSYNNYYEFGYGKSDPEEHAHRLRTRPWTIRIDGLVKTPVTLDIERILKLASLEERIYRLRCVEGWSMVVPWVGYSLSTLLKQVEPLGSARFIEVETVLQSDVMHGTRYRVLDWPYIEGLRLDEAMHPLTLLAVGLYGDVLPNQNGAPARLVVPWKYGFKSGKSITRIRFVERQPETTWIKSSPTEYGFFANVNPAVDHPRWSQARERRIGDFFKRETLPFNGYAEQVASLYAGMDLRRNF